MAIKHFHDGELRLQNQAGMREKIDKLTQRLMLDYLTDQHREFFAELEYVFVGTVDHKGQPHASILTGDPTFVYSPNPHTLQIQSAGSNLTPAFDAIAIGQPIGVLGIDLSNRRRNRMHGRIAAFDDNSISVNVVQSYGNCPKYISKREVAERVLAPLPNALAQHDALDAKDIKQISAADTFFIASYVRDDSNAPYEGVDVNHRGGQPGFVSVDSASQITIPDYTGNYLFNTFGNLLLNPHAGLLFMDFDNGDQLHIHGQAALIEDEAMVKQFPGAQRLLRVQIQGVRRQSEATSLRWRFVDSSPFSPNINLNKE